MPKTNKEKTPNLICQKCGKELTPQNSRPVSSEYSITGVSVWCIDCEQEYFEKLAAISGKSFALFHCCAAFNVPCKPFVFKKADYEEHDKLWIYYLDQLEEQGEDIKNDEVLTFFDGETDLRRIFGSAIDQKDFVKYLLSEKKMPTLEQRQKWGTARIWGDMEMTADVYNSLDREYYARLSSFSGQTLTLQQENTLRTVAKNSVIQDYCMRNQQVKHASEIQKMTDTLLASEQMRKKDEKPVENFRIDSQIQAFEKMGLYQDGKFLGYEDTVKAIQKNFLCRKKYKYSLDAADQMILDIYNTMRRNSGLMAESELPEDLMQEDANGEFETEETEEEKERRNYAGLIKQDIHKNKSTKKTNGDK